MHDPTMGLVFKKEQILLGLAIYEDKQDPYKCMLAFRQLQKFDARQKSQAAM
jgi:hypothetical protein